MAKMKWNRTIENIKHFLSVEGSQCVFVIGVDKSVLSAAIKARYASEVIDGEKYLEKIVNLSLNVPSQIKPVSEQFILNIFQLQMTEEYFSYKEGDVRLFADILTKVRENNPRRIRALATRYLMYLSFVDSERFLPEIIIRLIMYKEFFSDAYDMKERNGVVQFVPKFQKNNITMTFTEIEEEHGKGFAEIATTRKYFFLKTMGDKCTMFFINNFFEKTGGQLSGVFSMNSPEVKDVDSRKIFEGYIERGICRRHNEYFETVNFLFSFTWNSCLI